MEQPIYTYTFSKSDHDALQNWFFDQDIFGSSWKGEELIQIYPDRIIHSQNGLLKGEYAVADYEGFYIDPVAGILNGTWRFVILVKKSDKKDFYEKYLLPFLMSRRSLVGWSNKTHFRILWSKVNEFSLGLGHVLPEINKMPLRFHRKRTFRTGVLLRAAVAGLFALVFTIWFLTQIIIGSKIP